MNCVGTYIISLNFNQRNVGYTLSWLITNRGIKKFRSRYEVFIALRYYLMHPGFCPPRGKFCEGRIHWKNYIAFRKVTIEILIRVQLLASVRSTVSMSFKGKIISSHLLRALTVLYSIIRRKMIHV